MRTTSREEVGEYEAGNRASVGESEGRGGG